MGLYEDPWWFDCDTVPMPRRDLTILDILAWAADAGGPPTFQRPDVEEGEEADWMGRRGPLQPDSPLAVILWDFLRAVRDLKPAVVRPRDHRSVEELWSAAYVALLTFGFSHGEIALLRGRSRSSVTERISGRVVGYRQGRPRLSGLVAGAGLVFPLLEARQRPVRDGGLIAKTTTLMNGGKEAS
jgi:hypothetical protein